MRVVILVLLTLVFSNCSKPEKSQVHNDGVSGAYGMDDSLQSNKGREPVVHVVEIVQMKFVPDVVNVRQGDTVVWVNNDMVIHDVTEQHHNKWTSSPISVKGSWRMVVTESADYYCSLHVVMKGKIAVH